MSDLMKALVENVVVPVFSELSKEAGQQRISIRVLLKSGDETAAEQIVVPGGGSGPVADGEMRIIYRSPLDAATGRFLAEAIVKDLAPPSGYSGFSMDGKLYREGSQCRSSIGARTNRYNVWEWGRKFREF